MENCNKNEAEDLAKSACAIQDHVGIDQSPGLRLTLLLGFQHFITMFVATMVYPFLLINAFCAQTDPLAFSQIFSTIIVTSGLATLLQSTLGSRLPIIQGGSIAYLVPTIVILEAPRWRCPSIDDITNATLPGNMSTPLHLKPPVDTEQFHWTERMREIQGAIICASILEIFLGCR
jgi:nucleobase transporter 1/2